MCVFVILFSLAVFVQAKKLASLVELLNPDAMVIGNNRLYITEGTSIYIYSLGDFRLVKKFGKEGEGPQEFKIVPFSRLLAFPYNDKIYISSYARLSIFSRDGDFITEFKTIPFTNNRPFRDIFVGTASGRGEAGQNVVTIYLFNEKFVKLKELYVTDFQVGESFSLDLPINSFEFLPYRDRLYVTAGKEGLVIDVFDEKGSKLSRIKKDYNPLKVTEEFKNKTLEWFKTDLRYKNFWDFMKKRISFKTYFPAINYMFIEDQRIYILTHKKEGGNTECLVMDLKGNELKRVFLPCPDNYGMDYLPRYGFCNGNFYCLVENEDGESWELHMTEIK